MIIATTERLELRQLELADAPFMLELLNDPAFLRNIGDRGVRTLEDAERHLRDGALASYRERGYGMYLVTLKETAAPIGICGLLYRPLVDETDVGYAFLPQFTGAGYATEAAAAVLDYGRRILQLRVVAFTSADNDASVRVLEKLGLRYSHDVRIAEDGPLVGMFV